MTSVEVPDPQTTILSSSAHTTLTDDEKLTCRAGDTVELPINTPFPSRLPPLTVPIYPSQVPTLSTSFNTPYASTTLTSTPQPSTITPQQRSGTKYSGRSYGYCTDVSFPARPPNQRTSEPIESSNDHINETLREDSLVSVNNITFLTFKLTKEK